MTGSESVFHTIRRAALELPASIQVQSMTHAVRGRLAPGFATLLASSLFIMVGSDPLRADAPEGLGPRFENIADDDGVGIDYRRQRSPSEDAFDVIKALPEITFNDLLGAPNKGRGAPGVAILDADGDGDLDLYVTNGPGAANSLYANQQADTGALTFLDVAAQAGVEATDQDSTGVCWGDLDNDGDPDLVVLGNLEANRLFENLGGGLFVDVTAGSGIEAADVTSVSCSIGDIDGDGLLDLVVGNAYDMAVQTAVFLEPFAGNDPNHLFRNRGGLAFDDVSVSSGIREVHLPDEAPEGAATITWALALVDIDLDGDVDLVTADDQGPQPNGAAGGIDRGYIQLFENDGSGHFVVVTAQRSLDRTGTWMGLSFGDFDSNGHLDLFAANGSNHSAAALLDPDFSNTQFDSRWFLQQDDGSFFDPSTLGLRNTPFGWGTIAGDLDLDGDTDIAYHGAADIVPFVSVTPGVVFVNDGHADFVRDRESYDIDHLRRTVHGFAAGDLDGDGFEDLVSVSNFDMPEPIPLAPLPPLGGDFDVDASLVPTFIPLVPGDTPFDTIFGWTGIVFTDGTLSVERNLGNSNRWVTVDAVGSIGLTPRGQVNRDGIGAVVRFRPRHGASVLVPVLGGASYGSQSSLTAHLGLGNRSRGDIEMVWPGGVRNRLYRVRHRERIVFPEIPCSVDAPLHTFYAYRRCVRDALDDLEDAGVLDRHMARRFRFSALIGFFDRDGI